ncbi:MAG: Hsp70 family protein [Fibrobacter sp.]|nr:Hsp70 family protein [Fibrobacter sp.]
MAELIAGIDLGTTNSEISFMINGKITVIPVKGDVIMPSCVGLDPRGELIVGKAAKNQMVSAPESTIVSIKRKMGQNVTVMLGNKELTPEEVSAMILSEMKEQAEQYLKQPVKKAVITVPAFFQDHQRQATIEAGKLAGLDVVRIINEPTAAAVAYEADHSNNQRVLVYDLGGGTFDVSLVTVENGVVEVLSSHGDTHLGGDDFDNLLIDHIFEEIRQKHNTDLSDNLRIRHRLWKAAEKAKRELSDNPFATIKEEFITSDIHLTLEISRDEYEQMIMPLLNRTLDSVHQCLKDGRCLPGAIDRILLVGGATRTPLVHTLLERELGKTPSHEINPDLIVSMGAAAHGAVIGGAPAHSILVDITPHTFGTSAVDFNESGPVFDKYVPIIKRNSPLPVSKTEAFSTIHDEQEMVEVNIYQGEDPSAINNTFIGKFMVQGLSKVPSPNVILLNLELTLDGVLRVTATEKATGLSKTVMMDTTNKKAIHYTSQTDEIPFEKSDLLQQENHHEIHSDNAVLTKAKSLKKRAEKLLSADINPEDASELRDMLEKSREAISAGEMGLLSDYNNSLEDLIFYLEE